MERVKLLIEAEGKYRASEILADLRGVAEALYYPLKLVGYWDSRDGNAHLCPYERRQQPCPHVLPIDYPAHVAYERTVEYELDGHLDVYVPHAQVHIFLG